MDTFVFVTPDMSGDTVKLVSKKKMKIIEVLVSVMVLDSNTSVILLSVLLVVYTGTFY